MNTTPVQDVLLQPIAWKSYRSDRTVRRLLSGLQANIVKGHGREDTRHLFFSFQGADREALRAVVRRLARNMPSALDQLEATEAYKAHGRSGGPILCFFLRPSGYAALGAADKAPKGDPSAGDPDDRGLAFADGLQKRGPDPAMGLHDPGLAEWDEDYRRPIDAMLLVADEPTSVAQVAQHWRERFEATGATTLVEEAGRAIKRKVAGKLEGVEHFGYVDGRSQPLFLAEDVEREPRAHWDPAFPPSQFLVKDPGDEDETSFGSFFVFRKLEQDVAGFKEQEDRLAHELGLDEPIVAPGQDEGVAVFKERAGALLVGRFEDGTPVVLDPMPTDMAPINDFTYRSDEKGRRCPFVAHIRKTNPRGESPFHLGKLGFAGTVRGERGRIMARRGITYGERAFDEQANDLVGEPRTGVGLLFMAYMASIEHQFEFTQRSWANNENFVAAGTGLDPVIGQGAGSGSGSPVHIVDGWGTTHAEKFSMGRFVHMKGGEYFFAPSLRTLVDI